MIKNIILTDKWEGRVLVGILTFDIPDDETFDFKNAIKEAVVEYLKESSLENTDVPSEVIYENDYLNWWDIATHKKIDVYLLKHGIKHIRNNENVFEEVDYMENLNPNYGDFCESEEN